MQRYFSKAKLFISRFWLVMGITILGLVVVIIVYLANRDLQVVRDDTISIQLSSPNDPRQLVYEGEYVRVILGYDQYLKYVSPDEKRSIASVFSEQKSILLDRSDEYLIAEALESGHAYVFDKAHNRQVTRINVRYYEYWCGFLCGQGSRIFYVPDKSIFKLRGFIFLEVIDWIS